MTSDLPRPVGRVPVAIYICIGDAPAADIITAHVRAFAEARLWPAAVLAVDSDPAQPLTARLGWQAVTDALSKQTVVGVVTWTRDMLHDDPMASPSRHAAAFDRLATVLRERGAFLAAAHPGTVAVPLRRSPGDHWRRRELASSAAGLFTPRRAAGLGTDPRHIGC
ncbi:hypothetical protein ACFVXG_45460 [Kitasatospora sp. NPDC058162]|uniref:hypothetical protein n=1 Tax=Kitasatospora sp. NPDC058162 TaxID=3346362 RepID=UPI0036DEBED5